MVSCNIILLVTKEQQKIEIPRDPKISVAESCLWTLLHELVKYGKEFPQIYVTKGRENGYCLARTSYYGSAVNRVTVSFYGVVPQLPAARYH